MTTHMLLDELQSLGVKLSTDGTTLHIDAPKGVITRDFCQAERILNGPIAKPQVGPMTLACAQSTQCQPKRTHVLYRHLRVGKVGLRTEDQGPRLLIDNPTSIHGITAGNERIQRRG